MGKSLAHDSSRRATITLALVVLLVASIILPASKMLVYAATDTAPPTGSVIINGGAMFSTSTSASLTLSCIDASGCSEMKITTDNVFDTEVFEPFATSKTVTISSGDGLKVVKVIFKDAAGNISSEIIDDIVADTNPPSPPIITGPSSGSDTTGNPIITGTVAANFLLKWGSFCDIGTTSGCVDPDGGGPLQLGDGQFRFPSDLAIDSSGNVYVADFGNYRIQKFDSSGSFLAKWGSLGTGNGQFNGTADVAVDASGNVYVIDGSNHRVQKFTSGGAFITAWGTFGSGDGQFKFPTGIEVDSSGNVYVADTENHRIQKFTSTGTFVAKWGSLGTGNGQFDSPAGVQTDTLGNVYVADRDNDRIQKFTSTGAFITKWGTQGSANGQFDSPTDVTVDPANNVYVADNLNERIQKFTSSGAFLATWGFHGTGDGQFAFPVGVESDSAGNIYVADEGNHRVQKFEANAGNAVVEVFDDNNISLGTVTTSPSSSWTLTPLLALSPDGIHSITASVKDAASLASADSTAVKIIVDTTAPTSAPVISFHVSGTITSNASPVVNGTVASNFLLKWGSFCDIGTTSGCVDPDGGGSLQLGDGQFNVPHSIASDSSGNLYITEFGNNRVQKFTSTGTFLAKWGSTGAGNGQFQGAAGIAIDSANNVYVVDNANNRVQKFTSDGTFVTAWGSSCDIGTTAGCIDPDGGGPLQLGDGQFKSPVGIAVDSLDNVYVAEFGNNRVQKFTSAGAFLAKWGTQGSGDTQFQAAHSLAIDSSDNVYVTDFNNHRVQKFTSTGTFLAKWGSNGSGDGQFLNPKEIGIDSIGNVFVSDSNNHRIQKFSSTGTFLAKWGSLGSANGQLNGPQGVMPDSRGNIYVADANNHRIQKFEANTGIVTVEVFSGATSLGTADSPASGTWSLTPSSPLANGLHAITARVTEAGMTSTVSTAVSLFVYTTTSTTNLSGNAGLSSYPNVAASGTNVHLVWEDTTTGNSEILYRRSIDGGDSFGATENLSNNAEPSRVPYVVVNASNAAYVVWEQEISPGSRDIFVRRSPAGDGNFDAAINVSNNVADSVNPHIAAFGNDVHVVWAEDIGDGKFDHPHGVVIDASGNIYVADTHNSRIQKFTSTGVFLAKLGSLGSANGQFHNPNGIAIDSSGNIYVADTGNHRIQKFTSSGTFITAWGSEGSADGQFNFPRDVAVDSSGNVYVADEANGRIQKFTSTGTFLTKWGTSGSANGQFNFPEGIAVDHSGLGLGGFQLTSNYAGSTNIKIDLNGDGDTADSFSGASLNELGIRLDLNSDGDTLDVVSGIVEADTRVDINGDGDFIDDFTLVGSLAEGPSFELDLDGDGTSTDGVTAGTIINESLIRIDLNHDGDFSDTEGGIAEADTRVDLNSAVHVYVADTFNDRIQKFNADGAFITAWGTTGTALGSFDTPVGIAVDSAGNVYVTEVGNDRIQKFTNGGFSPTSFGSFCEIGVGSGCVDPDGGGPLQSGDGQFFGPAAVAVDPSSGNLVVVDTANDRVQKFTSALSFSAKWGTFGFEIDVIKYAKSSNGGTSFGSPLTVSSSTGGAAVPYVFVNGSSFVHVVWQEFAAGSLDIFYAKSSNGGTSFGVPDNISDSETSSEEPHIVTSDSNVHIMWAEEVGGDKFNVPQGVAVGPFGDVYVVDRLNARILQFTVNGTFISNWGSSCNMSTGAGCIDPDGSGPLQSGDGQFFGPVGIATDPLDGHVYVADTGNHRIQKFDGAGTLLAKWGSLGSGDGQFNNPVGIDVDPLGKVYVTELGNDRVQKFTSTGTFITKWGSPGSLDGQFNEPYDIAVSPEGASIYVTDQSNNRVQKFNNSGGFLAKWGSLGALDGEFSFLHGISVDSSGDVYTTEEGNHRIQRFTSTGTFVAKWGTPGSSNGQFNQPTGIDISADELYVADSLNHRIQKFSDTGTFMEVWGSQGSSNYEINYARSIDGGTAFLITSESNNAGNSTSPYLAVSASNLFAVWEDHTSAVSDVFVKKSTNNGESFGGSFNLSSNTGQAGYPESAISGQDFLVAWGDTSSGNEEIFYSRLADFNNNPPVANAQSVTTNEDTSKAIILTGTDLDSTSLTFTIFENPVHGTLSSIVPTGPTSANVTYTPLSNYEGADSFIFSVRDGTTTSLATVSITVTPVPDAPAAFSQSVTTNEDTPVVITLVGGDSEADTLSFAIVSNPTSGTLGSLATFNSSAATITYTPNANFGGTDSFTFRVNDGSANSSPATVSITVNSTSDPPTANAGSDQTVDEGSLVTLGGTGTDPEGSAVGFHWTQVSGPAVVLSNSSAANPTFTAPAVTTSGVTLQFRLIVTDSGNQSSNPDTVVVTIVDKKGTLIIKKVEQGTTTPTLAGAQFKITPHPQTLTGSLTIQDGDPLDSDPANGIIQINSAEFGTYVIEETVVPSGFSKLVESVTVSVHSTQQSPTVLIENLRATVITQPVPVPAPDLNSTAFNTFTTNGATVNGVTVTNVNDLPDAKLADTIEQVTASPPPAITFATAASPASSTQDLIGNFSIPTYPAPDSALAANNVYAVPAIEIPQQGSANKVLMTPVLEKTISDNTVVVAKEVPVASGIARLKQVEMTFSPSGQAENVAFSFGISDTPPVGATAPPATLAETTPLFLNVGFVDNADNTRFSSESAFATSPKIRIQVSKNLDIVKLADGCPDISLLLFLEPIPVIRPVGEWIVVNKPARDTDPAFNTSTECGYIVETGHFSKFAVGGVKVSIGTANAVVGALAGGGGTAVTQASVQSGSNVQTTVAVSSSSGGPVDTVSIQFSTVVSSGTANVQELRPASLSSILAQATENSVKISVPKPPLGDDSAVTLYAAVGDIYDVQAGSIKYSGPVEVKIPYEPSKLPQYEPESEVRFLHYDGEKWEDATISVDTAANTVIGRVNSLSPVVAAIFDAGNFEPAYFDINPLSKIGVVNTVFFTANGDKVTAEIQAGQQISVSNTIKNFQGTNQTYALILQILHPEGYVESLSWKSGMLDARKSAEISMSWRADEPGIYKVQIFVWDNIYDYPSPLSTAVVQKISVT